MSPMSMPLAQNGVSRPGARDEAKDVTSLLAIGADAKARIRILVVDDEHTLRESCATVLRHEGYDVTVCSRGQEALDLLKRRGFDIVLADLYMSQVEGLTLLRTALTTNHDTIVIVMTGNPSVESSVEALRQGAFDYLPKPFSASHLQVLIGRAVHTLAVARETREQQEDLERRHAHSDKITLLGTAPSFRRAIELARKVAPTDASVFITGESGSGKEMIAQFIHHHSRRSSRPFIAVNCAALPEGLLESEMFGHRKGAFTGALRERPEDIPLLADYFLSTYWVRHRRKGAPFPRLTDAALRTLCGHSWRGNVRELQNVIEHVAVVVEPGAEIRPEDLQLTGESTPAAGSNPASLISTLLEESYHAARDRVIAQFERQYLTGLVNRASGNMSKAARIAGVDRTTLYRLMERHGLQRSPTAGWVVERESAPGAESADPVEPMDAVTADATAHKAPATS